MARAAVALLIALLLNASANLMIKFGMLGLSHDLAGRGLFADGPLGAARLLLRQYALIGGLTCFALNVVFYAYALKTLPISVAYPIMVTVGFALIAAVAGWKLGETLSPSQWVGVVAILAGVTLVARDAGRQLGAPAPAAAPAPDDAGR